METKANYVAVGTFVLVCLAGLVIALLWLAGSQYQHEYAYYQTNFAGPVTGLGEGTTVRYNGIDVGRVTKLEFDPSDPKAVVVTLQVDAGLTLHQDSVASIESQGLAGGSYVEITGGTKDSPILQRQRGQAYAVINSKPSSLQQLYENTPELLARLNLISAEVANLLNDQNRKAIGDTLANLRDTTAVFSRRSSEIDATLRNIAAATKSVDTVLADLHVVLANAGETTQKLNQLSGDVDRVVTGAGLTQMPELISETRTLVTSLSRLSKQLDREPTRLLFGDRYQGYTPP